MNLNIGIHTHEAHHSEFLFCFMNVGITNCFFLGSGYAVKFLENSLSCYCLVLELFLLVNYIWFEISS